MHGIMNNVSGACMQRMRGCAHAACMFRSAFALCTAVQLYAARTLSDYVRAARKWSWRFPPILDFRIRYSRRTAADTFVELEAVVAVLYFVSHAARLANASASARASATISDGVATAGPEPQPYVLAAWLGHAGRVGCTRRPSGNTMRGGAAGWLLRHLNAIHVIIEEHRLRQNVALPVRSEEPCEVFIYSLPSAALIYFRDARAHAGMRRCHRGEC